MPAPLASTDYVLQDWHSGGLRAPSCFRAYLLTVHRSQTTVIGHLSSRDWIEVRSRVRTALADETVGAMKTVTAVLPDTTAADFPDHERVYLPPTGVPQIQGTR